MIKQEDLSWLSLSYRHKQKNGISLLCKEQYTI